jgi:hypothetical protein
MLLTVSVVTFCHHSGAHLVSGTPFCGKLEEIGGARPPDAPLFALPVAKSDEEDPPLGSAVPGYLALSNHSPSWSSCANASPTLCSTKKMLRRQTCHANPQTVVRSPLETPQTAIRLCQEWSVHRQWHHPHAMINRGRLPPAQL